VACLLCNLVFLLFFGCFCVFGVGSSICNFLCYFKMSLMPFDKFHLGSKFRSVCALEMS